MRKHGKVRHVGLTGPWKPSLLSLSVLSLWGGLWGGRQTVLSSRFLVREDPNHFVVASNWRYSVSFGSMHVSDEAF